MIRIAPVHSTIRHGISRTNADAVRFARAHDGALGRAFSSADAESLSALFSDDATYDDLDGGHHQGREAIRAAFDAVFAELEGHHQTAKMEAIGTSTTSLGNDAYRVHERWRINYYDEAGNRMMERFAVSDGVMKVDRDASGTAHPQYVEFKVTRPTTPRGPSR